MPAGRPKGSKNNKNNNILKGVEKYKSKSNPKITALVAADEEKIYYCTSCGKGYDRLKSNFRASQSPFYQGWGYIPICQRCLDNFKKQYTEKLGNSDEAIKRLALHLDLYVSDVLLKSSRKASMEHTRIASYISKANLLQYKGRTYDNYIDETLNGGATTFDKSEFIDNVSDNSGETAESWGKGWSEGDIRNKKYVAQTIGYDCFDDANYTPENKKFLYNTLSDYLTDDVLEDQHALQSTIAMVKTLLQRENIDRLLNAQIRQPVINHALIEQLSKIKNNLTGDINSTARDNAISAKNSGKNGKSSNTLTNITKEMLENNFDDIKINIVDVKMSNAYQHIAEKNSAALTAELMYQSDDYARLLSESRAFNESLQDRIMLLEEENRKLKIENKKLSLLNDLEKSGDAS